MEDIEKTTYNCLDKYLSNAGDLFGMESEKETRLLFNGVEKKDAIFVVSTMSGKELYIYRKPHRLNEKYASEYRKEKFFINPLKFLRMI